LPYCLVNRLYAYGTGGPVSLRYDRAVLDFLVERFAGHEYRVPDLLREIALSQAFSQVRREPESAVSQVNESGELPSKLVLNQ
jgi:hypothetical protein